MLRGMKVVVGAVGLVVVELIDGEFVIVVVVVDAFVGGFLHTNALVSRQCVVLQVNEKLPGLYQGFKFTTQY